jgi:hypothetical protein
VQERIVPVTQATIRLTAAVFGVIGKTVPKMSSVLRPIVFPKPSVSFFYPGISKKPAAKYIIPNLMHYHHNPVGLSLILKSEVVIAKK